MIEYEKQLSEYLVQQIYIILNKVCNTSYNVPKYKIIFNFETAQDLNQYIFEGIVYKDSQKGLKIRGDNIFVEQTDEKEIVQCYKLCEKYELVLCHYFDEVRLSIIFDIPKKPYINILLDYFIKAYISTKEEYLQKLLKNPAHYKNIDSFFYFSGRSRFIELSCEVEEELIISRAVTEFFFFCYDIDINFVTFLSCQTYEGESVSCNIYFPRRNFGRGRRHAHLSIKFRDDIEFSADNVRRIRKIMEMARYPLNLVVGREKKIMGYTEELPRKYEGKVSIYGKQFWKFALADAELIYNEGVYRLNSVIKKESATVDDVVYQLSREQNEQINQVILEAKKQIHGTTLIFGDLKDIKSEAIRLANYGRGILISAVDLKKKREIITNITAIDGAIMLDYECRCYAIGVILDGDMVIKGKPERGARYNSVTNYVERQKSAGKNFFAVVISEDRTIDLYPIRSK